MEILVLLLWKLLHIQISYGRPWVTEKVITEIAKKIKQKKRNVKF